MRNDAILEQFEEEGKRFAFIQQREQEILERVIDRPEFMNLLDEEWDTFMERALKDPRPVKSLKLRPPPKTEHKHLNYHLLMHLYVKKGFKAKEIAKMTCNAYGAVNAMIRMHGLAKLRKDYNSA